MDRGFIVAWNLPKTTMCLVTFRSSYLQICFFSVVDFHRAQQIVIQRIDPCSLYKLLTLWHFSILHCHGDPSTLNRCTVRKQQLKYFNFRLHLMRNAGALCDYTIQRCLLVLAILPIVGFELICSMSKFYSYVELK